VPLVIISPSVCVPSLLPAETDLSVALLLTPNRFYPRTRSEPTSVETCGLFALQLSGEEWFEASFPCNSLELFIVPLLKERETVARSRCEFVCHVNLRATLLRKLHPGRRNDALSCPLRHNRLDRSWSRSINSRGPTAPRAQCTRRP